MKTIKLGDPQPHPCPQCGGIHGYQVGDKIRVTFVYMYDSEGNNDGSFYSDSATTSKKGLRADCSNCMADLKIKIDRSDD